MAGTLSYAVDYSNGIQAGNALTGELPTADFVVRITGTQADVELLASYSNQEEARQCVEPFLHAWEMAAASHVRCPVFRFRFLGAQVPRADGAPGFTVSRQVPVAFNVARKLDVLPTAPSRPLHGPWFDAIWMHFRHYREGREALVPTAYMCLTLLQASVPGRSRSDRRRNAERTYGLPLGRLGELTAKADPKKGRKIDGTTAEELTPAEEKEIELALGEIVRAVVRVELQ
jgi:hypothetical protein